LSELLPNYFIHTSIEEFITINKALHLAMTYKFLGMHHYHKSEPGIAVSCLEKAFNEIKDINLNTKNDDITQLLNKFNIEKQFISALLQDYQEENTTIFRERVPDAPPELPEIKILSTPIPFEPPEPLEIEILKRDGFFCIIQ